jgi:O-acetyl-ADP-ribose deacetylase (regulator of RNase III)
MQIILSAIEDELVNAWQRFCGDLECVVIHHGSIVQLSCDAVVSPANSFGFMDGGIDRAYAQFFGWQVQDELQDLIKQKHHGELLVGQADIIRTDNSDIPFLIAAPTMRVPMQIEGTVNPYLAARAVLLLIKHGLFSTGPFRGRPIGERVHSVAFPGLGTGVGGVNPNICAVQVRAAIEEVVLDAYSFPETYEEAQRRQAHLLKPASGSELRSKAAAE